MPVGSPAATSVIAIAPGGGQSGFFQVTFTLPSAFSDISLDGAANVDDRGRAFLNGHPLTPDLGADGQLSQYADTHFSTADASLFVPGVNTLLISDDNSGGGPSAAAFYANITYAVPEPAALSALLLPLALLRRRRA